MKVSSVLLGRLQLLFIKAQIVLSGRHTTTQHNTLSRVNNRSYPTKRCVKLRKRRIRNIVNRRVNFPQHTCMHAANSNCQHMYAANSNCQHMHSANSNGHIQIPSFYLSFIVHFRTGSKMKLVLLLMVVVYLTHVTCDDPSCFYVCCNPSCSVKCRLCYQGWNGVNQNNPDEIIINMSISTFLSLHKKKSFHIYT